MKQFCCILFAFIPACIVNAQTVMHNGEEIDSVLLSPECKPSGDVYGRIFTAVEIPASFKGGAEAWFNYCNKHFDFDAVIKAIPDSVPDFSDSVIVKFVVTRDGNICAINFIEGNKILLQPVLELLRGSPPWVPSVSGGRNLHSYRMLRLDVWIDRSKQIRTVIKRMDSYWIETKRKSRE